MKSIADTVDVPEPPRFAADHSARRVQCMFLERPHSEEPEPVVINIITTPEPPTQFGPDKPQKETP